MNIWRGTACSAASTLSSRTPCLATRATMALRTASDTSGDGRSAVGIGVGKAVRVTDLPTGAAGVARTAAAGTLRFRSWAALRVAVCGVITVRVDPLENDLSFFSTTDDSDKGKRLGFAVIPVLSSIALVDY